MFIVWYDVFHVKGLLFRREKHADAEPGSDRMNLNR